MNQNGGSASRFSGRIYKCSIYSTPDCSSLVRDFIPCYSVENVIDAEGRQYPAGTVGLYDLVEEKFYTNKGGGDGFIPGLEND